MMDAVKRQRLEAAGWRVGNAEDFLGLSPEEVAFIEMKLSLSKRLRELLNANRPSLVRRETVEHPGTTRADQRILAAAARRMRAVP